MQSMIGWYRNLCLDPEIWDKFMRNKVDPALMPVPSDLQLPQGASQPQIEYGVLHSYQLKFTQILDLFL